MNLLIGFYELQHPQNPASDGRNRAPGDPGRGFFMKDPGYNFTAAAATAEAQVHLNCETGKDVQIHIYNVLGGHSPDNEVCTYTVQPQTVGGIVYHNNGDGSVTVTANSSVATTRVQGAALTCGSASGTSTYAGDTVVKGTAGQSVDVG